MKLFKSLIGVAAAALMSTPIAAHTMDDCAKREVFIGKLEAGWDESQSWYGSNKNRFVELYVNTETGTWTITETNPEGITCQVASGTDFQFIREEPVEGDPA